MKKLNVKNIFNGIGYYLAWWACVIGVSLEVPYLGPLVMAVFLTLHFLKFSLGKREFLFVLLTVLFGTMLDSFNSSSKVIEYEGGYGVVWLAPLWISAMWGGFAATVNHALAWLNGKLVLSGILGAVFGPLSYVGGAKFGAVDFGQSFSSSILVLAAMWGLALPFIYWTSSKLKVEKVHV